MKYLTYINSINDLDRLNEFVDGFIAGSKISYKTNKKFNKAILKNIIKKANILSKEIFILANKIIYNNDLKSLNELFIFLKDEVITGIIVSDLSTIKVAEKYDLLDKIIYDPNTLITNNIDFNYLEKYKINGAFISNVVDLNTLKSILNKKEIKAFYTGFGYINLFNSKRKLVKLYHEFDNKININNKDKFFNIKEETRTDLMPLMQDENGTYIFSSEIFNATDYIFELDNLDYFVFDNIFISTNEMEQFLKEFKQNNKITASGYKFSLGFLNRKIGYRK